MLVYLGFALATHGQTTVRVDPAEVHQEFEGWGTSLCWWAHGVGRWSDANLDPLIGKIVDPDTGLGYSIFRYNIGGGDKPGHSHFRKYGDVPGFKPTETGTYDWNADPLSWPGGNQMDVSLWMADVIIKDIRDMKVNAWLDLQTLDGGVWGSFSPDYERQKAPPNKRFYMHAQFSRYIRPGSRIIESSGDNTLAAPQSPSAPLSCGSAPPWT